MDYTPHLKVINNFVNQQEKFLYKHFNSYVKIKKYSVKLLGVKHFVYTAKNLHLSQKRTELLMPSIRHKSIDEAILNLENIFKVGVKYKSRTKKPIRSLNCIYNLLKNLKKCTPVEEEGILCIGNAYLAFGQKYKRGVIRKARGVATPKHRRGTSVFLNVYIIEGNVIKKMVSEISKQNKK